MYLNTASKSAGIEDLLIYEFRDARFCCHDQKSTDTPVNDHYHLLPHFVQPGCLRLRERTGG